MLGAVRARGLEAAGAGAGGVPTRAEAASQAVVLEARDVWRRAETREEGTKIFGLRRLGPDLVHLNPRGVKHVARRSRKRLPARVGAIAQNRVPEVCQADANLVQEAGPRANFHKRAAAKKGSLGNDKRPASKSKNIKGVHCHTSTIITVNLARTGSVNHLGDIPKFDKMSFTGPRDS